MSRILVLAFTDLRYDARVARQVDTLKKDHNVTLVCFETNGSPGFEVIKIQKTKLTVKRRLVAAIYLLLGFHERGHRMIFDYDYLRKLLEGRVFDLVVANDAESLPFAFHFNTKVLFDAHEYSPRQYEDKLMWLIFFKRMNSHICSKYIPRAAGMTTVGRGLAREYLKNFGKDALIITNAPPHQDISPSPMQPDRIRMIHHGGANSSRRLELMIEMVGLLDERFSLDMMLMSPPNANRFTRAYLEKLGALARATPRVRMLPPIAAREIVTFINQYDMGVYLLPPVNFNSENTLPNKYFDFIQARLGVATGPSPEMADITRQYDIGVVSKEFTAQSLADALNALSTEDVMRFKQNSSLAAREHNADVNAKRMLDLVGSLTR
jgi:hypothetical protein